MMIKQECFSEVLLDGAREVFESMMFMTLEENPQSDRRIEGACLLGSVTFQGPVEGCLAICCNIDCARSIALNMLGLEPGEEITDKEVAGALGEAANMVMGTLKSRIMDSFEDIQVSIPSVVSGNGFLCRPAEDLELVTITVSIDGFPAKLDLMYR